MTLRRRHVRRRARPRVHRTAELGGESLPWVSSGPSRHRSSPFTAHRLVTTCAATPRAHHGACAPRRSKCGGCSSCIRKAARLHAWPCLRGMRRDSADLPGCDSRQQKRARGTRRGQQRHRHRHASAVRDHKRAAYQSLEGAPSSKSRGLPSNNTGCRQCRLPAAMQDCVKALSGLLMKLDSEGENSGYVEQIEQLMSSTACPPCPPHPCRVPALL